MKKLVLIVMTLAITTANIFASDVVATVDGKSITKQEIDLLLKKQNVTFDKLPADAKKTIINQLVDKQLLVKKVKSTNIKTTKAYKDALKKVEDNLAFEIWMKNEFTKIKISEKETKAAYEKYKDKFVIPEQYEARHILVKSEKEAKDLIIKLNKATKKKSTFEELAKLHSTGPTGSKGGYLGKFPAQKMVPEFSHALSKLKKGEYTKTPVKTQFGFHIIYLDNKIASTQVPYEKAKANLKQGLTQEKFAKSLKSQLETLRKNAKVVIK